MILWKCVGEVLFIEVIGIVCYPKNLEKFSSSRQFYFRIDLRKYSFYSEKVKNVLFFVFQIDFVILFSIVSLLMIFPDPDEALALLNSVVVFARCTLNIFPKPNDDQVCNYEKAWTNPFY